MTRAPSSSFVQDPSGIEQQATASKRENCTSSHLCEELQQRATPDFNSMDLDGPLNALVGASLKIAQVGADLSGVPGLPTAVKLLAKIAQLAQNVPRNRHQATQLSDECSSLYSVINRALEGVNRPPEVFVGQLLKEFTSLLTEIIVAMSQWADLGFWESFVKQGQIAKSIARYGRQLSNMKDSFQIGVLARVGLRLDPQMDRQRDTQVQPRLPPQQSDPEARHSNEPPERTPQISEGDGRYDESERKDRRDAVLCFTRPDISDNLKDFGNAEEVTRAMGKVIENMDDSDLDPAERQQLKQNLFILSEAVGHLPKSLRIPPEMLEYDSNQALAGSSIYDIYEGKFLERAVAIKKARGFACVEGYVEHILKEVKNWWSACEADPNEEYILHLIGISFPDETCMMISKWMKVRDLLAYIKRADVQVDRMRMVQRIAKGLEILHGHNPPIAHGHLKASNIMINDKGEPLLGDFGLSKSLKAITGQPITDIKGVQSFRWFAPELLSEEPLISTRTDIYSFGMTVLEVMTGESPFKEIRRTPTIPEEVRKGKHPAQPTEPVVIERGLDDRLWALLTRCWAYDPSKRPDIFEVNRELEVMWGRT